MVEPKPLIILGTGGSAYDVLDVVEAINSVLAEWQVVGFLDDGLPVNSGRAGLKVLGRLRDASNFAGHYFINSIGSEASYRMRPAIIESTGVRDDKFAVLVHPKASVSARAKIGHGVYVNSGASIGGEVEVGNHVCIGPGAIVGHDAVIGEHTVLAPGALISGFVRLGKACYVGAGAALRQKISVGDRSLVGIGATVLCDVSPDAVVIGNPARLLSVLKD